MPLFAPRGAIITCNLIYGQRLFSRENNFKAILRQKESEIFKRNFLARVADRKELTDVDHSRQAILIERIVSNPSLGSHRLIVFLTQEASPKDANKLADDLNRLGASIALI